MLTKQLRELEADNLIVREIYREIPPKVEYSLTDYGKTVGPVILALQIRGGTHLKLNNSQNMESIPLKTTQACSSN